MQSKKRESTKRLKYESYCPNLNLEHTEEYLDRGRQVCLLCEAAKKQNREVTNITLVRYCNKCLKYIGVKNKHECFVTVEDNKETRDNDQEEFQCISDEVINYINSQVKKKGVVKWDTFQSKYEELMDDKLEWNETTLINSIVNNNLLPGVLFVKRNNQYYVTLEAEKSSSLVINAWKRIEINSAGNQSENFIHYSSYLISTISELQSQKMKLQNDLSQVDQTIKQQDIQPHDGNNKRSRQSSTQDTIFDNEPPTKLSRCDDLSGIIEESVNEEFEIDLNI
jgi:hypothetical protein